MAKLDRYYWDSCAWLGLLNGEKDKRQELEMLYSAARNGRCEIWTSTYSQVEVNRYKVEEGKPKPLAEANLAKIESFFQQSFIKLIPVDFEIGRDARKLLREWAGLSKRPDAVHLASALRWSVTALHTYDGSDLLHLSNKIQTKEGNPLLICLPGKESDGPLFSQSLSKP